MKSWIVHYQNKYPGGRVESSDSQMSVYCASGKLRVRLEKNGAGQWLCKSEEHGADDKHCLAPIPKNARARKLYQDGHGIRIGKSEEHQERSSKASSLAVSGRILSIEEYKARGVKFDDAGNALDSAPPAAAQQAPREA